MRPLVRGGRVYIKLASVGGPHYLLQTYYVSCCVLQDISVPKKQENKSRNVIFINAVQRICSYLKQTLMNNNFIFLQFKLQLLIKILAEQFLILKTKLELKRICVFYQNNYKYDLLQIIHTNYSTTQILQHDGKN